MSICLVRLNKLSSQNQCILSALEMSTERADHQGLFASKYRLFGQLIVTGQWQQAETIWTFIIRYTFNNNAIVTVLAGLNIIMPAFFSIKTS